MNKLSHFAAVRHGVAVLVTATLVGIFLLAKGGGTHGLNLALADAGVVLIALSMIMGPLARLRPRLCGRLLLFRREIGIWGGVTSLAHVVVLASGKLGWNPLGWFLVASESGYTLNTGSEGLGNLIGTVAALCLLVLTLTSNDWSQKKLGAGAWKFVQQLTYTAFVLVALHGVVFLYGGHHEGGMPPAGEMMGRPEGGHGGANPAVARWTFWGATLGVVALQGAGFLATVRKKGVLRAEA